MSETKDGGPAFPTVEFVAEGESMKWRLPTGGMTLRDYFMAAALKGVLASGRDEAWTHEKVAEFCRVQADAMIAERNKGL